MAIPRSSALWLREQSRVPSLSQGYVVPLASNGTMNPSDFHNDPPRFRFLMRGSRQPPCHRYGSPALGNLTSDTCRPCYPDGSLVWLPLPTHPHFGLPYTDTRSATAFSLRGYFWVHLRYGLHLRRLGTHDPRLLERRSFVLPRCMDNSLDGTLTR